MVEIIPKPIKKIPRWKNFLPYFALALLIVAVLSYYFLVQLEGRSLLTLQDLEERIASIETSEKQTLKSEILAYQNKIDNFSLLLAEHQKSSNFFKIIEDSAHPKVWFKELQLNLEKSQVVVTGFAKDFRVLGQQSFIFKNQESIQEVNLSDLSLGEGGEVEFTFRLFLNPRIFQ